MAEPVLDITALASGAADTLVDGGVLAAVEERPDEVDTNSDDEDRVDGDAVCVEANGTVLPRGNTEKTKRETR